ncbi:GAF domain-containing protein [Patescibacteria group bacterium]|nr:GAF domain-containing protein [Patescibacteria group bacterium]
MEQSNAILILGFSIAIIAIVVGFCIYIRKLRSNLKEESEQREAENSRRMYELSILKEIGERAGYSLNTQRIADIITGSLKELIDYSTTAYILEDTQKKELLFKCKVEESVSPKFIEDVKNKMVTALSALTDQDYKERKIEEVIAGTILDDEKDEPLSSFFNIPLTVGDKVVGMLNVSSTKTGLYKEDEMTILYKITAQASNAVTRLQDVLDSEQSKLNAMVVSMADGVLMIDKENRVYVINPKVKELLGIENDEISIFDIIEAFEGKVDFRTKLEECIKLNRLEVVEETYLQHRYIRILFSPVKDKNTETLGAVIILHDITHDKELEKIKEDFTNMMVHDLRSPLNGVRLIAEMLQDKKMPKDQFLQSAKMIHESTTNILELVNDLLDVAKLESGKFIVSKEKGDLKKVIEERIAFFNTLAEEKSVSLNSYWGPDIPSVLFDEKEIIQVLNNLLSNAIKFTKEKGEVTIQTLLLQKDEDIEKKAGIAKVKWFISNSALALQKRDKDVIICAVTDNGSGIPQNQIKKLFSKFEQAEGGKQAKVKGTGLGLVIAKGITEAHGGLVSVESMEGEGSTFYFTLPLE